MIEVRLFATFREGRSKILQMDLSEVKCPGDVVAKLGIDPEQIAICLINGFHCKLDTELKEDDVLFLFPPVAGG